VCHADKRAQHELDRPESHRVFVALKFAPEVLQQLADMSASLEGSEVRRVAAGDIHLTLVPPWNESAIFSAVSKLSRVAEHHDSFELHFKHVGYGADPRHPRFLWVECLASSELAELRAALLTAFERSEQRPFRPHVTLARIRERGGRIARKHPIDRDLVLSQRITSVELMRSPPPSAIGYTVLASVPLGTAGVSHNPG